MLTLDVAIATLGSDGIRRTADMDLPPTEGVRYVVSWQTDDDLQPIPSALRRNDITVTRIRPSGVSDNRNNAFRHCNADIVLCADDDLSYTSSALRAVITSFEAYPDIDYGVFRYSGDDHSAIVNSTKRYPAEECAICGHMRGFSVCTFEMAVRRSVIERGTGFDPRFGPGGEIACGEDEMFFLTLRKLGLRGRFFPITVAHHKGLSTGFRKITEPRVAEGMGTVIGMTYPVSAILRIPLKAWRLQRHDRMAFPKALFHLYRGWLRHFPIIPLWKSL